MSIRIFQDRDLILWNHFQKFKVSNKIDHKEYKTIDIFVFFQRNQFFYNFFIRAPVQLKTMLHQTLFQMLWDTPSVIVEDFKEEVIDRKSKQKITIQNEIVRSVQETK